MNASTWILFAIVSCPFSTPESAYYPSSQFTVESWNVDSIDPDPHMAALHIAETEGVHLWGLCGVRNEWWAELFRAAAAEDGQRGMTGILSPTRGSDRLLILYDPARFELIRSFEFSWDDEPWHRPDLVLRPALIAQLRHNPTGQEFFFMVNCLHPKWTAQQVHKIAQWAGRQSLPVIAAGTYYFQHNLGPEPLRCEGQAGLSRLLADGVFQWVRPEELVTTYDSPFNTIEDFLFVAHAAGKMYGQSRIVVGPDDFARGRPTGAHRPVRATFTILDDTPEARLRRQIVDQALKVQTELDRLEALVRQMPE